MRVAAVADTHTAIWYLFGDARLSARARAAITEAADNRHKVAISSITLVEVGYLVEKNRVPATAYDDLTLALEDPEHVFTEAVLTDS